MLAVLSACSKWNALQRWGLFFNPQTFWKSFLKAEPASAMKAKEA